MIKHEPPICLFCGEHFEPHPKVGSRQLACKKWECKRQRVKRTKKLWYDEDPTYNYSCVKKYRQNHPDAQKKWRQRKKQWRQAQLSAPLSEATKGVSGSLLVLSPSPEVRLQSERREIRNQLTLTKTTTQLDLFRSGEIRNQLSLCITLPLAELLTFCQQGPWGEIRNQLTI